MLMKIETLRKRAGREEVDYSFMMSALSRYACPREKISAWLKSGELIRVKKGLYVFGESAALHPYSKEVLANLIYGPSAISLTYALGFYGLIPERVESVTSITSNRYKFFNTAVGDFIYYYLPARQYTVGIVQATLLPDQPFLISTPEKALCDQLYFIDKRVALQHGDDMEKYLFHHLRIDENLLLKFKLKYLQEINHVYQDARIRLLMHYLKKRK